MYPLVIKIPWDFKSQDVALLYRTMSSIKSHASSEQNFFIVVVKFLETFVGSMSAGKCLQSSLLAYISSELVCFLLMVDKT